MSAPDPEVQGPGRDPFAELDALKKEMQKFRSRIDRVEVALQVAHRDNNLPNEIALDGDGELVHVEKKLDGLESAIQKLEVAAKKILSKSARPGVRARPRARPKQPATANQICRSFDDIRANGQDQRAADATFKAFQRIRREG